MIDAIKTSEDLIEDGLPPKAAARIAQLFASHEAALVTKAHLDERLALFEKYLDLRLIQLETKLDVRFTKIEGQLKYTIVLGLLILGSVITMIFTK